MKLKSIRLFLLVLMCIVSICLPAVQADTNNNDKGIDLLQRYPTNLTKGRSDPKKARKWEFSKEDIYQLSEFSLKIGNALEVNIGVADVGIGHCIDGAVWAVVIPRERGYLKSKVNDKVEMINHLWIRFHPVEIVDLFPKNTVNIAGDKKHWARMQKIANLKIRSSWQAGGRAMIPGRNDLTVDAGVKKGKRRFFVVDSKAATARYVSAFENRIVPEDKPFSKDLAKSNFDQLWEEYDRGYAMFILRPKVNWEKLRQQYRTKAIESASPYEFALVCAEMLKHLRDLHIWVKVDGQNVPVFNRPRERNANPLAFESIIGKLDKVGKNINWGKTKEKIGFIAIDSWSGDIDEKFDEVLENMRDTRGLIIDVRLNGGGSEPLARNVAGRFIDKEYIYAYSQYRNGPNHTDLTEKYPRKVGVRGPWRYDRPVVVLMGQKCMSSNESFVSMMAQCPQVTTMGDHTCGSSGNPKFLDLPGGVRISLPQWIDLLPDKTPLDERGVQPDMYFPTKQDSFEGNRDDLIKAAIDRLTKLPLPKESIPGQSIQEFVAKRDAGKPCVVSVWPPDGAEDVEPETEIRIRFDKPMDPGKMNLRLENRTNFEVRTFNYNEADHEFIINIKLEAGCEYSLIVNNRGRRGFLDRKGNVAKEFKWKFQTKDITITETGNKPTVKSISPTSGSKVALVTKLRLTFDQPMHPDKYELLDHTASKPKGGCYVLRRSGEYLPDTHQFIIPVVFPPDWQGEIELRGFKSTNGVEANPVIIKYSAEKNIFSQDFAKHLNSQQKSSELKELLEKIKKMRSNLQSLSETVYTTSTSSNSIRSNYAIFKMKGQKQFYADVSKVMGFGSQFIVGSDGENCWWYHYFKNEESVVKAPFSQIEKNITICDPFHLTKKEVQQAIKDQNLEYLGIEVLGEQSYYLVRSWSASLASEDPEMLSKYRKMGRNPTNCRTNTWWIDAHTYMPVQMKWDRGKASGLYRFVYKQINEGLDDTEFLPEFVKSVTPKQLRPLEKDNNIRFLNAMDGSNGKMSVRWGQHSPDGGSRWSSGLN